MLKAICQAILLGLFITSFFTCLYQDFHGRKAREPYGFSGAVISIVMFVFLILLVIGAGAMSEAPFMR